MQIQTQQGEKNVASQAVAGTALGLAIPGTLSFLSQLVNGSLGFWNTNGNVAHNCPAPTNNSDTRTIGALYSDLLKEKSERYSDGIGIATFKEAQQMVRALEEKVNGIAIAVAGLDKQIAVDKQQTVDNFAFLNNRIDDTKKDIMCYVNATFVPGKLVMPLDAICPPAAAATSTT